jgi:hypothetical protein
MSRNDTIQTTKIIEGVSMTFALIFLFSMLSCAASDQQKQRITILPGVYLDNNFIRGEKVVTLDVPSTQTLSVLEAWLNKKKGRGNLTVSVDARPLFDSNNLVDSNDRDMYRAVMPTYGSDTLSVLCEKFACTAIAALKFRFVFNGKIKDARPLFFKLIQNAPAEPDMTQDRLPISIGCDLLVSTDSEEKKFRSYEQQLFDITPDITLQSIHDSLNEAPGKGSLLITCPVAKPYITKDKEQELLVRYGLSPFKNYCAQDNVVTFCNKIQNIGLKLADAAVFKLSTEDFIIGKGECPIQ